MKVQLETITSQKDRSFSLMFNPRLSDLFFWHSHPEYELVYIEGHTGTRHIGEHVSTYYGRDLVLIGSNIPHLNFDYGMKGEYRKVVIHLEKKFVENHFDSAQELKEIRTIFEMSKRGLAFYGDKISNIGERMFLLKELSPFDQYLQLIKVLKELSSIDTHATLHEENYQAKAHNKEQEKLRLVHAFIDNNYQKVIQLEEPAEVCSMSKEAFCRFFKKNTTYTFVEFLNRYRITHAKRYLMKGESISEACYQTGFQSLSYFTRTFKKVAGETPSNFKKSVVK